MQNLNELSPLALAFMGDAIHTCFVREKVLQGQRNKLDNYHNLAKNSCNALNQKQILEKIEPLLTEEEKDIVRRARNAHSKHKAKNFDEETYKKATSFEALIGFLYLSQNYERLNLFLEMSIEL
ncbi:MAG: ribonuclease III [Clostridiales bacterium]|nr:ribonuclease III [Clostridiales bacterium]